MSVHIGAKETEIAERILLPGDPLRAKYIAEAFLQDAILYNEVRGMYGYTGTYKGKRISVQGTGMGIPSISIYAHELIYNYGVKQLIRVGSCGGVQPNIKIRDVILAMASSTDSSANRLGFKGMDYAPTGSFELLQKAYLQADQKGLNVHVGSVFTSDTFYNEDPERLKLLTDYQILAIEMETTALYTIAAKAKVQALSILTVSDHIVTGEETTAAERQNTFNEMIEVALETAVN